jgi:hypothetical protein
MGYRFGILVGAAILTPLLAFGAILATQVPAVYYADFRWLERKLSEQPGVRVVRSHKHEDVLLEDCAFTLKVRACPPVRVDFYDGRDWRGLFERIDGVAVCPADGSARLIRAERLAELGLPVHDLPGLLAHLEGVLAASDRMAPNGAWPGPRTGRWVVLRCPLDNGLR